MVVGCCNSSCIRVCLCFHLFSTSRTSPVITSEGRFGDCSRGTAGLAAGGNGHDLNSSDAKMIKDCNKNHLSLIQDIIPS